MFCLLFFSFFCFFFQAEDGIRDLVRSRGLGDVYKRQALDSVAGGLRFDNHETADREHLAVSGFIVHGVLGESAELSAFANSSCPNACLLYTSDAADERSIVDLGGRRII